MAVVKCNYVKPGAGARQRAKASVRYIQYRRGKDGAKITRVLFGIDGAMERTDALRMIDEAGSESVFFRFIISPDGKTEDTRRDLHLREVTEQTMNSLEEQLNKAISWVAAVHDDHTPNRHVHMVAIIPGRLPAQDFRALPQVLIQSATKACLEQRYERDLTLVHKEQEREEAEWGRGY